MYRRPSRKERSDYFVCSDECKSEVMKKEGNPNWEGGHEGYRGSEWYELRRKRKKRDNHNCVLCRKGEEEHKEETGRSLEVHHVMPFEKFERPKDANHIDNLLTLCASCHRMIESGDSMFSSN